MKVILKDKTEIEVQEGVSLTDNVVIVDDFAGIDPIAKALVKKGNLDSIKYVNSDGVDIGIYSDLKVLFPLIRADYREDGKLEVVFGFQEKTETEKRLDTLEAEQSVQDGAIMELAGMMGGE